MGAELPDEALFQERTLSRVGKILITIPCQDAYFSVDSCNLLSSTEGLGFSLMRLLFLFGSLPSVRTHLQPPQRLLLVCMALKIPTFAQAAILADLAAGGSNAGGFPPEAMAALTGLSLTNSTSDLVEGGLPYIIEFNDIGMRSLTNLSSELTERILDRGAYRYTSPDLPPTGRHWLRRYLGTFVVSSATNHPDLAIELMSCACRSCGDHTSLGAEVSTTFRQSQTPFQVTYGSGAVAGQLCADTMEIAGMTLEDHVFGVTTQVHLTVHPYDPLNHANSTRNRSSSPGLMCPSTVSWVSLSM